MLKSTLSLTPTYKKLFLDVKQKRGGERNVNRWIILYETPIYCLFIVTIKLLPSDYY